MTILTTNKGFWTPSGSSEPTLGYTTNLWAHWKANSLSLSDNDAVASWADSSGNGYTMSQATAGNKPVYKTNIVNGYPAVLFTSASSQFMATSGNGPGGTTDLSIIWVVQWATGNTSGGIITWGVPVSFLQYVNYRSNSTNSYFYGLCDNQLGTITYDTFQYGGATYDQSESDIYMHMNGTKGGLINALTANINTSPVQIGKTYYGEYLNGYIAEILIYTEPLSDENWGTVETYLTTKYDL